MAEKYYKISKVNALRAGRDERMRTVVDNDFLLLNKKDIDMISLTFEEKLDALGAIEWNEDGIEEDAPIVDNELPEVEVKHEKIEENGN